MGGISHGRFGPGLGGCVVDADPDLAGTDLDAYDDGRPGGVAQGVSSGLLRQPVRPKHADGTREKRRSGRRSPARQPAPVQRYLLQAAGRTGRATAAERGAADSASRTVPTMRRGSSNSLANLALGAEQHLLLDRSRRSQQRRAPNLRVHDADGVRTTASSQLGANSRDSLLGHGHLPPASHARHQLSEPEQQLAAPTARRRRSSKATAAPGAEDNRERSTNFPPPTQASITMHSSEHGADGVREKCRDAPGGRRSQHFPTSRT